MTTQLSGSSIAQGALVVLIGPSGSGKSTFAQQHFKPTQVVSSDACRAMVADDEADQAATTAAFAVLHLSLIHISEPTRLGMISYAVFCLKKKNIKPTNKTPEHTTT